MTDRDRLIELFEAVEKDPAITCPHYKTDKTCDTCKYTINNVMCNHTLRMVDYLLANGVIVLPCKIGDKVAVRALCECVHTLPIFEECRNECPFEDDCPCEECDNGNERIFVTRIDRIFNDGYGWKFEFRYLSVEASLNDLGVSFFVGDDAEQLKTHNPCDDCEHSFSKNNQQSDICKRCEFKRLQVENEILQINAANAFQEGLNENRALFEKEILEQFVQKLKTRADELKLVRIDGQWAISQYDIDRALKETLGEDSA